MRSSFRLFEAPCLLEGLAHGTLRAAPLEEPGKVRLDYRLARGQRDVGVGPDLDDPRLYLGVGRPEVDERDLLETLAAPEDGHELEARHPLREAMIEDQRAGNVLAARVVEELFDVGVDPPDQARFLHHRQEAGSTFLGEGSDKRPADSLRHRCSLAVKR